MSLVEWAVWLLIIGCSTWFIGLAVWFIWIVVELRKEDQQRLKGDTRVNSRP